MWREGENLKEIGTWKGGIVSLATDLLQLIACYT
jgi:hypothetical protein